MQFARYICIVLVVTMVIMGKAFCRSIQYQDHSDWIQHCPKNCTCSEDKMEFFQNSKNIMNCSNLDLSHIPLDIPAEAEVLLLAGNKIREIKKFPVGNNLQYIDLSDNIISEIKNHFLFASLTKVQYLSLKNNVLKKLLHGCFSGMSALEHLDLSNNGIHSMEIHAFSGINQLKYLILENNNIRELNKLTFFTLTNLEKLDLSQNLLSVLPDNIFENLSRLTTLKILNNYLKKIGSYAFKDLTSLTVLDISNNALTIVPTEQLQRLPNLHIFIFDGNEIFRLNMGDFSNMNLSEISVSFMPNLKVVEIAAFENLPALMVLQLHDNPNLLFINPQAFQDVQRLSTLYLHNNRLKTISADIKSSLPSLTSIHLYHNPLRCDCNVYWIKQEIIKFQSPILFEEPGKLVCDEPRKHVLLFKSVLPRVCPPTTLPLFQDFYNLTIADELRLECQALGIPRPQIHWFMPESVEINETTSRVEIINNTVLFIRSVRSSDTGTYGCQATNEVGLDTSSTAVRVNNKSVRLIPYGISSKFITLTWNGTEGRTSINNYQLQYGECHNTCQSQIVNFGPFSPRRYTVRDLKPSTTYQFCILYKSEYQQHLVDCLNLTTAHSADIKKGITKFVTEEIITGVCVSLAVAIALACTIALCRKFTRRKEYEKTSGQDKVEVMSSIPLQNLYNPSSTLVCSSQTALIDVNDN